MRVPLTRGMVLRHQGHLYHVADFHERKTGKMKPTVHVQLRDLRDGHQVERTLDELEPLDEVETAIREAQYLYARGDAWVFMDNETFDEMELTEPQLAGFGPFLVEGETYRVLIADGRPVALQPPETVVLRVVHTAPPVHAGGSSNVYKEAEMENGLTVMVPLFIRDGDLLRVLVRDRSYAGKEKAQV